MAHEEEFQQMRENHNENLISTIFNKLEGEKDGKITAEKLANGGKDVGINLKLSKASKMIAEIDENDLISAIFNKLGGEKDGKITAEKLVNGGKDVGINLKLSKASTMIAEIDENGNGFINFKEFRNCMQKMLVKVRRDNDIYKKSFKKFDQDGNGFIDKDELRSVLCGNGSSMSEAEVEVLLHEADVDGDGKLSYEEFVEYFCKI